jgi:uncharacterized circularly permuted ATP-grasp superfamily protein
MSIHVAVHHKTVRDHRVFLKTLDGLRPEDVILRGVSDGFRDSLVVRGDSLLGVPGLVETARAGLVSVANTLGSGLAESPAFLPFLLGYRIAHRSYLDPDATRNSLQRSEPEA